MPRKRRRFTREFKIEAVRMVDEDGHRQSDVARDLRIRPELTRRWRHQLRADPEHAFPGEGRLKPVDEDLRRLQRENRRLREEREILKKPWRSSRSDASDEVRDDPVAVPRVSTEPFVLGLGRLAQWLLRLAGSS